MILTIDIGNSRVKWAQWENDKIVARGVAAYASQSLMEIFDALFLPLTTTSEVPLYVYAICVAGDEKSQVLNDWILQHWRLDVEFLATQKKFKNIINAYKNPELHGVDRWVSMVASCLSNSDSSLCVISAGTAITVDLVDKDGSHLGGYILPSFATMHSALLADTANVDSTYSVEPYKDSVPNNTNDAVNQGLHKMLRAGICDICQFAQSKMSEPMKIILTGGFADVILAYPDMPVMLDKPDLVMQGIYSIKKNTKNKKDN